eukprot:m.25871 g.25871  ORF g.25871 m.25871 type:complete len:459 (+) comp28990_c0_seq2:65-1441(+)
MATKTASPSLWNTSPSGDLSVGNIAMGPTFLAFRNAVRGLFNFGDFEAEELGSGFQGIVYKVTHKRTGQVMVLKKNREKSNRKRTLQEIQILNQLDHPNIVRYVGACVCEGQLHPLTEFVNGGDMLDLLKDRTKELSWRTKMRFARDIADGMAYLHSKNFYHRDIASKNCLLRRNGDGTYTVVVADFGFAGEIPESEDEADGVKAQRRISLVRELSLENGNKEVCIEVGKPAKVLPKKKTKSRSGSMRKVQSIVGTTFWMAPEVLHGVSYTEKADIFSYAIVLCEVIARVDTDPDILKRTEDFGLDAVAFRDQCISDGLKCPSEFMDLVFQCSNMTPSKRPSFSRIGSFLNSLLKKEPLSPPLLRPDSLHLVDHRPSYSTHIHLQLRSPTDPIGDVAAPNEKRPSLTKRHSISSVSPTPRRREESPRTLKRCTTLKISHKASTEKRNLTKKATFKSYI